MVHGFGFGGFGWGICKGKKLGGFETGEPVDDLEMRKRGRILLVGFCFFVFVGGRGGGGG